MTQFYKKNILLTLFLITIVFNGIGQNKNNIWTKVASTQAKAQKLVFRNSIPKKFENYQLDINKIKTLLLNVSKRTVNTKQSNTVLNFPNDDGTLENYQVFEASIMEPALQKKYPNIRSYIGKSTINKGKIIRFSIANDGFHGMIFKKSGGTVYIDPYTVNTNNYIVYNKKSLPQITFFECRFDEFDSPKLNTSKNDYSSRTTNANDGNLRTYRLAIATTGEYAQYQLNYQGISSNATDAEKKAAVLSAINTTMTRVNGLYERDISLTMVLVANETDVIFLDGTTDPFTNNDGNTLINESQTVIDNVIGLTNYDIGHTFSTGGGGLAQLNSPCTNSKARGITGSSNPIGDAYDIDFVAHEMGHQFGAHHTFNGDAGSCSGNLNNATAVEPGSGSTIMAYAGICTPQNVQTNSDDYFHLVSIREIWANISVGNSSTCGTITATGNNVPVVNTLNNYSIPISTPFVLTANASDSDGDILTYTWEQLNGSSVTNYPLASTDVSGPDFRSVGPSTSPKRYFPDQNTVVAGNLSNEWEVLPSVTRTMKFGVNVRDNNPVGAQTASQENVLSFDVNSGPFKVTSQNTATTWAAGTSEIITWDVANTDIAPVSCSFVNIKLSTDGGFTYPTLLASNIPNNGSSTIVVPNITTIKARIIVESTNNVFYAMNTVDIAIQASEFIMNFNSISNSVCSPNNAVYNFTYNTFNGFNETTTFSATGNPAGTTISFNPTSAIVDGTTVQITVSGITDANLGNSEIAVTGTSTSTTKITAVSLNVFTNTITAPTLNNPVNNDVGVLKPYLLNWNNDVNASSYNIEISTDNTFASTTETNTININLYSPQLLMPNTLYYWRVKAINNCNQSSYSSIFNFTTANEVCDTSTATDTPLSIPDNNSTGASSVINISQNKIITDVNVTVNITHPYDEDLALTLTSPEGTSIILSSGNGGNGVNYTNTVFDDSGVTAINLGIAPFTGVFKPQVDLSTFNNQGSKGNWILKVVDSGAADIGTIDNWSLEICGVPSVFSLPTDNFNIQVTSETCPNKNNGQLNITANETHNYVVNITGTNTSFSDTQNFTNSYLFENLAPDIYSICITVTGENYQQCFVVEVLEGITVSGKSSVKANKATVEIEQGTAPYKVFVNGKEVLDTNAPVFTVNVKHGDLLEVKTAKTCEGVYSKAIELLNDFVVYPNPSTGIFEIAMPIAEKQVIISIYNIQSQLISQRSYPVNYGKVNLDISNQPTGIYIAKVHLNKPVVLKIIKR
ncbi:reprolysin-like metallopeptidase [Lutibacter sp.]|uniref:reprolysin-like metallopeptidase n=1 Tax=Lutibacter sp. TaxID=1925666 RepID=UPI0025BD4D53|nr:zinc-dependent metalloprotease family protein [Lutibacter sp.]MCF6182403.1 M12 family metallo-peptidase [Lutibacter sp.]